MTDQTAFPPQSPPSRLIEPGVNSRLLVVGSWIWRLFATAMVVLAGLMTLVVYADERGNIESWFLALAIFTMIAGLIVAAVWVVQYVLRDQTEPLSQTIHKVVLGRVPASFWCLLLVFYISAFANAVWQGSSNSMIIHSHYAEGVGQGFVILGLGWPFRFFVPKAYGLWGHMVGCAVVAVAYFFLAPPLPTP